jgi:hypothetical protein
VDATRLCHGTDDTAAGVKRLLRYGRKPSTSKDFSISGPEVRKSLRETFLGPKTAGRMPSLLTWFELIIIAGKGTTQQAKKFFEYMLWAEADSALQEHAPDDWREASWQGACGADRPRPVPSGARPRFARLSERLPPAATALRSW